MRLPLPTILHRGRLDIGPKPRQASNRGNGRAGRLRLARYHPWLHGTVIPWMVQAHISVPVRSVASACRVPIAAVTIAVIAANAIVAVGSRLWMQRAAMPMAALDMLLGPLVLLLTLWLFYRMVVIVSGDFFREGLLPGLTWEYERAV